LGAKVMTLTGVDIRVLIHELNQKLIGTWVVNIYHLPQGIFILKLRKPKEGLYYLLIEPGKRIHLTNFNRIMPKSPSNVCVTLRSHLRDRRINSINQRSIDRIVSINIGPDEGSELVVELFGEGNLILVSPVNKIITALWYRKMRDRDIHPGREFRHMPPPERDIIQNGVSEFRQYRDQFDKLVPALNNWLGLGPFYSKYLLELANVKASKSNKLTEDEIKGIETHTQRFHQDLINHDYSPIVYLDQGEDLNEIEIDPSEGGSDLPEYEDQWSDDSLPFLPELVVKILPWPHPSKYDDLNTYDPVDYNSAIDVFYSSQEIKTTINEESEDLENEEDRLTRLLNQQLAHQEEFNLQSKQLRVNAEALYANFQSATELISTIYEARKGKMSWDDIIKRLETGKEKGITSAMLFDSLLIEEAKLILSLPYNESNQLVKVDFRESLTENANIYFEKAKKTERKSEGANVAIERTRNKIELANSKVEELRSVASSKVIILKRRKPWYEKWRWTRSPPGSLVLSGFDASSNERLVKRFLDPDDMFFHADIQGAAATVVKLEGQNISKSTEETAAMMAVVYSAAWRAKRPMADVFYVFSDQVSLTPPSGEYLPKGSFMIYGEKKFVKNVTLELNIGLIIEQNWGRIVYGGEHSIKEASCWARLQPGEKAKGKIAKNIRNKFLKMVDPKDIEKVKAIDLAEFTWAIPGDSEIIAWGSS
jgi:predicted ribosome quality control (RQC) complex YloA/Tae2 family protein